MPSHRPSRGCVTITTAIALAFCMRIWMTGVFGLIDIGNMEESWIQVDALVVGRNSTNFGDSEGKLYWCARVEFTSHFGENITAISTTDCVLDPFRIATKSHIPIFYNPAYPKEFIEQDVLEDELTSLKVMVGVGVAVSIILSGVLCLLMNRQRHRPPQLFSPNDWEQTGGPVESPEERKEKILSKLYVVTVPEDKSNIVASSIRSLGKLDGESDIGREIENGNSDNDEEEKSAVDKKQENKNDHDDDKNDASLEPNQQECSTKAEENHTHASSTISSFLSDLILGPSQEQAECCICLGPYEPGEVVCASKCDECNHVFHKECLMDWMMKNNDRCPLCRVDFMKEEATNDNNDEEEGGE